MFYSSLAAEPNTWWAGQFVGYLLRYNDTVSKRLRKEEEKIPTTKTGRVEDSKKERRKSYSLA